MQADIIFDTSAINRLHDDSESRLLIAKIRAKYRVKISVINIAEVCKTPEQERRVRLLRLLNGLRGTSLPWDAPHFILPRAISAFASGQRSFSLNIGEDHRGALDILARPEAVNEEYRANVLEVMEKFNVDFLGGHRTGREKMQEVIASIGSAPISPGRLISRMLNQSKLGIECMQQSYRSVIGADLAPERVLDLARYAAPLTAYLLAQMHSAFMRGVQVTHYSDRKNAGTFDLWFSTYLPRVRMLITHDRSQYRALRLISRFFTPRCSVMLFRSFKEQLQKI